MSLPRVPGFFIFLAPVVYGALTQELHKKEVEDRGDIQKALQQSYNQSQTELDNLTKMRLKDLLTDEEFLNEKAQLLKVRFGIKEKLEDAEHRADSWLKLTEKTFVFANRAKYWFENGTLEDKKLILEAFGSNLFLKDKKIFIEAKKPFMIIKKGLMNSRFKNIKFEPLNYGLNKGKVGHFVPHFSDLHGLIEDVRTFFLEYLSWDNSKKAANYIYIPELRDNDSEYRSGVIF